MEEIKLLNFFSDNYDSLLGISKEYIQKYNYKELEADEIVSELLIFTLKNENRVNKLLSLMVLSATSNQYNHSNKAMYYITTIIYYLTKGRRKFSDNCNGKKINLIYTDSLNKFSTITEDEDKIPIHDYLKQKDIFDIALKMSKINNNWWKYKVWGDYYINKMKYRELSVKYNLTISPISRIVKDYNNIIKSELTSKLQLHL